MFSTVKVLPEELVFSRPSSCTRTELVQKCLLISEEYPKAMFLRGPYSRRFT